MFSPMTRSVRLSFLAFLSVAFFLALAVLLPVSNERRLTNARDLVTAWDLPKAEDVLHDLSSRMSTLEVRRLYADVLSRRGKLHLADSLYRELVLADTSHVCEYTLGLAFNDLYLGLIDSSRTLADRVLKHATDSNLIFRVNNLLGLIAFTEGRYTDAEVCQHTALMLAHAAGNNQAQADALRQLGVLQWYRGHHDSALTKYYKPALEFYRKEADKIGEATTLSNIGLIYFDWGMWEEALRYQLEAFRLRKKIGDLRGLADSYYFLSTLGPELKGKTFAYSYRKKSLDLSSRIGYAWGHEVASRSLDELWMDDPEKFRRFRDPSNMDSGSSGEGKLYSLWYRARELFREQRWDESVGLYRKALQICDSLHYFIGRNVMLKELGVAFMKASHYREAEAVLLESRSRVVAPGKFWPFTDLELAELYISTRRFAEARRILPPIITNQDAIYRRAMRETNPAAFFTHSFASVYRDRARAYSLLVSSFPVLQAERVFRIAEAERSLPFWGKKQTDHGGQSPSPAATFVRQLEAFDQHPEKFEDIRSILTTVGEIQQSLAAERTMFAEAYGEPRMQPQCALKEIQGALQLDEVLLEYFIAFRQAFVIAIRRNSSSVLPLPSSVDELRSMVSVLRDAILRGKVNPSDDLWKPIARSLYQALIAPIVRRGLLTGGDRLIISPHRYLYRLPFQALLDGSDTPVVEHFPVSFVPSGNFLLQSRKQAAHPIRSLAALAPLSGALPYSQQEAEQIPTASFVNREILTGSDGSSNRLFEAFEGFDVVHIATHAWVNDQFPFYSYIQCADRRVELHEILHKRIHSRVVFLSGCETGESAAALGSEIDSDDNISFPRALLASGAQTVIATFWPVEDSTTASFARLFYTLVGERNASESPSEFAGFLGSAQRQLIAALQVKAKNHPFYWAPFYLVGQSR